MALKKFLLVVLMFEGTQALLNSWSCVNAFANNEVNDILHQKRMILYLFTTTVSMLMEILLAIALLIAFLKHEDPIGFFRRTWIRGSYFVMLNQSLIILAAITVAWSDEAVGISLRNPVVAGGVLLNCVILLMRILGVVAALTFLNTRFPSNHSNIRLADVEIMDERLELVSGNAFEIGRFSTFDF